jgi:SAM-dependent methyltransferase
MKETDSQLVESLLAKPDKHRQWAGHYRTPDNEVFFEKAFDYVVGELKPPPGSLVLDVGCGSCAHSVRLARRGLRVRAVDFSESALAMARDYVEARGLGDRIELGRESLLGLSFPDESFDYALCWGVLMHIPEVERAVAELARVLRPGGMLVVSEGNMSSVEAVGLRALKRLLGAEKAEVKRTAAGMEFWKQGESGALVTRQADVGWLVRSFESRGVRLVKRAAGQFSEGYAMTSSAALRKLIHAFNNFWFGRVGAAGPAYGNILIFRKDA